MCDGNSCVLTLVAATASVMMLSSGNENEIGETALTARIPRAHVKGVTSRLKYVASTWGRGSNQVDLERQGRAVRVHGRKIRAVEHDHRHAGALEPRGQVVERAPAACDVAEDDRLKLPVERVGDRGVPRGVDVLEHAVEGEAATVERGAPVPGIRGVHEVPRGTSTTDAPSRSLRPWNTPSAR